MNSEDPSSDIATVDDVRFAIEALTAEDLYRLQKAASICLAGTQYHHHQEILNEAIVRTMSAANGEKGRRWPKSVPFMAYLIQTMKGLANDSRESLEQKKTDHLEERADQGVTAEAALGQQEHHSLDALAQVIELEAASEILAQAKVDSDRIDAYFADDSEVSWLIMGHKDGLSAVEIRELAGMTQTQYETARKRFRRGLAKLFPGRSHR